MPLTKIEICKEIVSSQQYKKIKIDGQKIVIDLFTASAIVKVYDALNEANKIKFANMPFPKMANVAMNLLNKRG